MYNVFKTLFPLLFSQNPIYECLHTPNSEHKPSRPASHSERNRMSAAPSQPDPHTYIRTTFKYM